MSPTLPSGSSTTSCPPERLPAAIRDPHISSAVVGLVQRAQVALTDLEGLDESLYDRFKGKTVDDQTGGDLLVRAVMRTTFRGLRDFIAWCQGLRPVEAAVAGAESDDFSFGDLEGMAAEPELDLGLGDIGALLEGIDEHPPQSEAQRYGVLLGQLSSIEYGLSSQLAQMEQRVTVALSAWEVAQAVEVLDDTQGSTSQGVFAALSAVCQAFLPDADPASLAPGHLTVLERALVVRQALADLSRAVAGPHARLQGEDVAALPGALQNLRATLTAFVHGRAFPMMRPADRWQLAQFERTLKEQQPGAAKFTSEGLAKYLESLASISRREVLILHDRRAEKDLSEALASAQQLALISPRLAVDPAQKAVGAALSLYGSSPEFDEALAPLRELPHVGQGRTLSDTLTVLERLTLLLR